MNIDKIYRTMHHRRSVNMVHTMTFFYRTTFLNIYIIVIECFYTNVIDTILQGVPITLAPGYSSTPRSIPIRGIFDVKNLTHHICDCLHTFVCAHGVCVCVLSRECQSHLNI